MERTPVKLTGMLKFSAFMLPSCVNCQPKPFVVLILGSQQENTHTPFVHQIKKKKKHKYYKTPWIKCRTW